MPERQPECRGCGHKLKKVTHPYDDNGKSHSYVHKSKEHWIPRPHKADPILTPEGDVPTRKSKPSTHDHHAPLG